MRLLLHPRVCKYEQRVGIDMFDQDPERADTPEAVAEQAAISLMSGGEDVDRNLHVLRAACPVHRSDSLGGWFVTGYNDVKTLLRTPGVQVAWVKRMKALMPDYEEHLSRSYLETFLVMDDDLEHHDRLRRIAQSKLDTKTVERMRPWIERAISEIVQRYVDDGGGDFVAQVAFQVAIVVISEVMGLPSEDRAWYWTTLKTSSVALEPTCSPESLAEADAATGEVAIA